jgi:hypothetical protein
VKPGWLRNFQLIVTKSLGQGAKKPVGESEMVRLRNGGGGEADVVAVDGGDERRGNRWEQPHREHKTPPMKNPEGQDQHKPLMTDSLSPCCL